MHGREEEIEILLDSIEEQIQKTFEVIREQSGYFKSLDELHKNQIKLENRIQTEFETFMVESEDFRTDSLNKMKKYFKRRFTIF